MIAALDVQYDDATAAATCAAVVFAAWTDAEPHSRHVVRTTGIALLMPLPTLRLDSRGAR